MKEFNELKVPKIPYSNEDVPTAAEMQEESCDRIVRGKGCEDIDDCALCIYYYTNLEEFTKYLEEQ